MRRSFYSLIGNRYSLAAFDKLFAYIFEGGSGFWFIMREFIWKLDVEARREAPIVVFVSCSLFKNC
jgi:hypothetical protein